MKDQPVLFYYRIIILFLVIIIFVLSWMLISQNINTHTVVVEKWDNVTINYTGKFQNGTIFESGNYTFTVGKNQTIQGIERAVLGMKQGESKTLTIEATDAYGPYNPELVINMSLVAEYNRTSKISTDEFIRIFGKNPMYNETYQIANLWPVRVIGIYDNITEIREEPEQGQTLTTTYGIYVITYTDDKIIKRLIPTTGASMITPYGRAKIISANSENMTLDFNHPLAGKTLIFDIKVLNITKS